jgi:hypothetical protein
MKIDRSAVSDGSLFDEVLTNEQFCKELLVADSEERVIEILEGRGYWQNEEAWTYYGGVENNFATIGNQSAHADTALVEKLVNSVDAVLTGASLERHIDPIGAEAPSSMSAALVSFFGIQEGKMTTTDASTRTRLAQNIQLIATGTNPSPCLTIVDKGEGHEPSAFADTFLSIQRSNKQRIPFVQGRFDMGGTGALLFCGRQNMELIVSKRNPKALWYEQTGSDGDLWGFTVVRRRAPTGQMKSSVFEYLAPGGSVLTLAAPSVSALPDAAGTPYAQELQYGTAIKLYEYQLGPYKTAILLNLYNRLSLLLPDIGMPIRVVESRSGYDPHYRSTTLAGLTVRLEDDRSSNLEQGFPGSLTLNVQGETMTASIYAFKRGREESFVKSGGIIFTRNGQCHFSIKRSFFERETVRLGYISHSVLVVVDCTSLSQRAAEDFFMNSRDRARKGQFSDDIEKELESQLKSHDGLRRLNEKRRLEKLEEKLGEEKPLESILRALLKRNPELMRLLAAGKRLPSFGTSNTVQNTAEFTGKRFPSYFNPLKRYDRTSPKLTPKNRRFRVQYETDAVNDFFSRQTEKGAIELAVLGNSSLVQSTMNLWDGIATLTVELPEDTKVSDKIEFELKVASPDRPEPFTSMFCVLVTHEEPSHAGGPQSRRNGGKDLGDHPRRDSDQLALPRTKRVYRDGLADNDMCEDDALKVVLAEDGTYDFFINMDNPALMYAKSSSLKSLDPRVLETRFLCSVVLLGMSLLGQPSPTEETDEPALKITPDMVKLLMRLAAPILLPITCSLADLDIEDVVPSDEELVIE